MEIRKVFESMCNSYVNMFKQYYPSVRASGYSERNLTFNFCHSYLLENPNAVIWQEILINRGDHFDTLIIDNENKIIIIIETKRLQSTNKMMSIIRDYNRIVDRLSEVDRLDPEEYTDYIDYKKCALLLADIWIPPLKNNNKTRILSKFEEVGENLIEQGKMQINEVPTKEAYWLLYNLYSI